MVKHFVAAGVLVLMHATGQAQTLVGYWDMNGTLARSSGFTGTLSAELEGFGLSYLGYGAGSTVNLESGFSSGQSLAFVDLATVLETGHVTASSLNLSGLTSPTFSFAVRSTPAFQIGDLFKLEYNIGGGWALAATLAAPTTSYELVSHTFSSGLLDNLSNVGIRITFSTVVDIADTFEVDNLKITAVPEPAAYLLLGVGVLLFLPDIRKRFLRF